MNYVVDQKLGRKIKEYRKYEIGLTQEQFAKTLGISRGYVQFARCAQCRQFNAKRI